MRTPRNRITIVIVILMLLTGSSYIRNSIWQNDVILFSDVVGKSPRIPRPRILLGSALSMQKKWKEAAEQFKAAQALLPLSDQNPHRDIGLSRLDQSSILAFRISAERDFLEQDPNAEGFARLGFLYLDAGEYEPAREQFRRAIALNPSFTESYGGLATAYIAQGLSHEAVKAYQDLIRHDPDEERAYIGLGILYMEGNRTNDAVAEFTKALRINPKSYLANYNLGLAYAILGLPEKAQHHYRLAKSLQENRE